MYIRLRTLNGWFATTKYTEDIVRADTSRDPQSWLAEQKSIAERVLTLFDDDAKSTLVDIACGSGRFWKFLPPQISIFGVDVSNAMLEVAESQNRGRVNLKLVRGDFRSTALPNLVAGDVVSCFGLFGNQVRLNRNQIKSLLRFVSPSGSVIFSVLLSSDIESEGSFPVSINKTSKMLSAMGLNYETHLSSPRPGSVYGFVIIKLGPQI